MGRLVSLLLGATAERSIHSRIGRWRLAVSSGLDAAVILPWPGSLSCGPLVNGAVEEILPAGALYPTDDVWYLDVSKTIELLRLTYTRDSSGKVTRMTWFVYTTAGSLALTVTDNITYSGIYEAARTRTVVR